MRFFVSVAGWALAASVLCQVCEPPKQSTVTAYPSGTIIEGIGSTDLPIQTNSEKCRQLCRQGFALIHSFWFNEAIRTFRDAIKEDPACATAYLGLNVALSQPWYSFTRQKAEADWAIKRAAALSDSASPVEQELIAAFRLRSYFGDIRETEFEKAMVKLMERHPNVDEPILLWAGIRTQICMGDGYNPDGSVRKELDRILKAITPVLKRSPNNPAVLHYHIHAVEALDPELAMDSALRLGKLAPASGHMVHMPGHIFYAAGRYLEGYEAFEKSRLIEEAYAKAVGVSPAAASWNYPHNKQFLMSNLVEMGRLKEAVGLSSPTNRIILWRGAQWDKLAEASGESKSPISAYFRGMNFLTKRDLESAGKERDSILADLKSPTQGDRTTRLMEATVGHELDGAIRFAQNQFAEGRAAFEKSLAAFEAMEFQEPPSHARTPHETYGQCLYKAGLAEEAARIFERGLKFRRNTGWILGWAAKAWMEAGKTEEAKAALAKFEEAWKTADRDLPEVKMMEELKAKLYSSSRT